MTAVQNAVQNGIENLSGSSVSSNAHPEDGYRFRARTKDELLQSQGLVPAVNKADLPPADEELVSGKLSVLEGLPPKANSQAPQGWLL